MLSIIKQNWHSFRQQPDTWFFYAFLATSTLSIRKVLYYLPINNSFNEYTGVYIYLSDIFLFLTFLSFILYNNNHILSNTRLLLVKIHTKLKMFHVEQFSKNPSTESKCSTWNNCKNVIKNVPRGTFLLPQKTYAQIINNYLLIFPLFIAFFSFISILWTTNQPIAIFRSIKLSEYVLLYFYIIVNVPRGTFQVFNNQFSTISNKLFHVEQFSVNNFKNLNATIPKDTNQSNCSTWNNFTPALSISQKQNNVPRGTFLENIALFIITTGLFQSTIGITQFITQNSIGLFWLKESLISPLIPGVAKIILNGEVYIRAYGLFPHPNIFGGYLVFSIILSILYSKLFHVEQFNNKTVEGNSDKTKCSTWNKCKNAIRNVPRGTLLNIIILIQSIALFLTFSKSAIIGLLLGLFYIAHRNNSNNVPRGTLCKKIRDTIIMFHVEHYAKKLILISSILIWLLVITKPNINSIFIQSLLERGLYLNISYATILSHPFLGVGVGQFIFQLINIPNIQMWQFQPVHNVFLLIASEYGIFTLTAFIFYFYLLLKNIQYSKPEELFHVEQSRKATAGCLTEQTRNIHAEFNLFDNNDIILTHLRGILLSFIFIMLFDHYFWDIQQGQILLWVLLALIVSKQKIKNKTAK